MLISDFGFRASTRPEPPIDALASKFSPEERDRLLTIPDISAPLWPLSLRERGCERCPVPSPCKGIKLIYCTSIKQRERTLFRQLNCWPMRLWSTTAVTPHAYIPYHPLSNPVSPSEFFSSENENVAVKDGCTCAKSVWKKYCNIWHLPPFQVQR